MHLDNFFKQNEMEVFNGSKMSQYHKQNQQCTAIAIRYEMVYH
jgi:hypothetical protein